MGQMCKFTMRSMVGLVGIAFLFVAVALFILSVSVMVSYKHYDASFIRHYYTLVPAVVLMVVGVFFSLAGLIACCAMCNHNKCLLTVLGVTILVLIGMLSVGTFMIVKEAPLIENTIKNATLDAMQKYNITPEVTEELDWFQKNLQCCGSEDPDDWQYTNYTRDYHVYPASCCNHTATTCDDKPIPFGHKSAVWQSGCYEKVYNAMKSNGSYIALGTGLTLAVLVIGLISTFVLCFIRRRDEQPYNSLTT